MRQYLFQVLDALGLRYGPSHSEIMLTAKGPVLIETGARVMGANLPPEFGHSCFGHSQAELVALAYTQPEEFLRYIRQPLVLRRYGSFIPLIAGQQGKIMAMRHVERLQQLSSFFELQLYVKEGEELIQTIDYATIPGQVLLVHQDKAVFEADYQTIRQLENNLFVLQNRKAA